ncbi:MAG TPA: hypothetical protein VGR15_03420 [Bacteroidota bacterium]|nr:hypothetical protein [Bacteroidota bacterium]
MKPIAFFIIVALASTILKAGSPPGSDKASPGFDKLKSLVGTWSGKDEEGKPVHISYKLVSAGSSIMETLDMADEHESMITMYHMNGKKLMMTHYCSLGNQPRMRADGLSKEGNMLAFSFVDATNLSSQKADHMYKLVFTFKDDNHFSQKWTMHMAENEDHPANFEFERVK